MSGRLSAVIFDLDGTLADSISDIAGSVNHVLARRGWPNHSSASYRQFIGEGLEVLIRRALPPGHEASIPELVGEYRIHYADHFADTSTLYPGIASLLDRLTALSCPMAILSNKREDFTQAFVARLFPRWKFEAVRGERATVPRKPDPTAALEVARVLRLEPSRCAFVGDTRIDMETATGAGMFPVGVSWGFRDREELVAHGAKAVIDSPLELLPILDGTG